MFLFSEFTCSSFQIIGIPMANSRAIPSVRRGMRKCPSQRRSCSVNEAGVFALRGRQEGSRRSRKTTTSTTSTTTPSSTVISLPDEVAQPAALLAPEEESWSTSSSTTTNVPLSSDVADTSSNPPLELVVKPHSKVILPCELEGNYSRLLLPGARSYRIRPATWLHEDNPVDMITIDTRTEMSGTGHRYIGDSTTAALHIDNVRLEDDGVWSCTLEDDRGKILFGRPVKLVVLACARATLPTPFFTARRFFGCLEEARRGETAKIYHLKLVSSSSSSSFFSRRTFRTDIVRVRPFFSLTLFTREFIPNRTYVPSPVAQRQDGGGTFDELHLGLRSNRSTWRPLASTCTYLHLKQY
ncbi:hypothetical protein ACFW04_008784 [Cataglyphis niger]